jgi:hypothetical protein
MAAAKTANRCHAGAVSPAGTGQNQIPIAITKGTACLKFNRSLVIWVTLGAGQNTAFQFDRAPLDRAILSFHHPLPGKLVGARRSDIPSRAAQELSCDAVARRSAFTLEFAEHLVTTLIRPDTAAHKPGIAIHKRDHLGAESYAGRFGPASSIVPLRSRIEARRSAPREMIRRLPAAFQEPRIPAIRRAFREVSATPSPVCTRSPPKAK